MPTHEQIAQLRAGLEAQRAEIAGRVIPDDKCRVCQHYSSPAQGRVALPSLCAWVRPCAACAERRPYAWVAKIPLEALEQYAIEHWDHAFLIEDLRVLLPPEETRGSARWEFL